MNTELDHIGIAVREIESALVAYREALGLSLDAIETVPEQGVKVAMLALGPAHIELLEPTDPDGPVGKFLAARGEGIHHISLSVPDLPAALAAARAAGLRLIDETPRTGAGGKLIAFLHPKSTHGVLIELSQRGEPRS
ncbi:MAG: methylmalonyl-CoA epimerase [Bacillota bacterium]|nr:methylmalonyl-CoA epimerase [Bacillota bacterium]